MMKNLETLSTLQLTDDGRKDYHREGSSVTTCKIVNVVISYGT